MLTPLLAKSPFNTGLVVLFCLLLSALSSASALDGVCSGIKQLGGCKAVIKIPTLALQYCDIPSVKMDQCQTKLKGRYPCGISVRGIKMCDGWTCIPGLVPTTIRGPCGVKVGSKSLDLCSVARKGIPKMDELVKQAGGICSCLPKILDFVDLDTVKSVVTSLDTSEAMASILNKYGDAQVCLIDNGFNVEDNKNGLTKDSGPLVTSDAVMVFRAAEIDLSRYIALATALTPCFVGTCNEPAIRGFFIDYLTDSEKLLGEQITKFLSPWEKSFDEIATNLKKIGDDLGQIAGKFETIKTSIVNITNDFCKNISSCAETTVFKFQKQTLDTIRDSEAFTLLTSDITKAVDEAKQTYKIISDAIAAFDSLADLGVDAIVLKVISGEIRGIKDIAATLQSVQKLPRLIDDIQGSVPSIQNHIKALQSGSPDFLKNIDSILQSSWLTDAKADVASATAAEAAVQQIQSLFAENVMPFATAISNSITAIIKYFKSMFSFGPLSVDPPSVASYQRWSKGHFAMLCLTTGKITLKLGGYKKEVDYPKFYRCEQDYRIPFPNHHILFIKITFRSSTKRSTPLVLGARQEVIAEPLTELNSVELPTFSTVSWPYISEAAASDVPAASESLAEYDLIATEIEVEAVLTSLSIPADIYIDIANVLALTARPSGVVFFLSTDTNSSIIKSSTILTVSETFEITATEVMTSASVSINLTITDPAGFEEGTLSTASVLSTNSSTTITSSSTITRSSSIASSTNTPKSTAALSVKRILFSLLAPIGVMFCFL
ncbi:hypothetical protein WAI453_006461 [Rhynchosporium graminicola]